MYKTPAIRSLFRKMVKISEMFSYAIWRATVINKSVLLSALGRFTDHILASYSFYLNVAQSDYNEVHNKI